MPSLWNVVDRVASATVDRVWGEEWHLFAAAPDALDPNAARPVDGSGPYTVLMGVYVTEVEEMTTPNAHDLRTQHRPGAVVGHPAVDIDIRRADFLVRRGDQIKRVSDGTRWRIIEIRPDVDGRRRLMLNEVA